MSFFYFFLINYLCFRGMFIVGKIVVFFLGGSMWSRSICLLLFPMVVFQV